ncbi:hydrogenase expression/formation protein HypE [Pseudalkalibacillus sp. R45]|uniref:hydrogenase expression/formation protein HypE n=1 Tax=Pseudalkalibacillus sp. R45 TaxID=3457433 RepID=UPI003FCED2A9
MKTILLSHGDGGTLTHELIEELFMSTFGDQELQKQEDAAILNIAADHLAFSTDTFVINPIEFSGGDIGKLAVCGTVNDLAVSGAKPEYLSVGFILEEGLGMNTLKKVVHSLAKTAKEAGVRIVTGDTKVVERGKCDQLYINTTGIGSISKPGRLGYESIQPGDHIIINGGIAEHAVSVLIDRLDIPISNSIESDCRPLNHLITKMLNEFESIRFMRDPTRGGIATTLKEIAVKRHVNLTLFEEKIPMQPAVRGALELIGMDPYYLANEGKVLTFVSENEAEQLVRFLKSQPGCQDAEDIGFVSEGDGDIYLKTVIGGTRSLGMLSGEPLPRIC